MKSDQNDKLEKRFAALLLTVEDGVSRPEDAFVRQLREESLRRFESAQGEGAAAWADKTGRISMWKVITESRITALAAAAVIIIAVLTGAWFVGHGLWGQKDEQRIVQPDEDIEKEIIDDQSPGEEAVVIKDVDLMRAKIAAELARIEQLYAAGDVDGLVGMLSDGEYASRIAAANYLAIIGDDSALGPLGELSEDWQGEPGENPFAAAIERIKERLTETGKQSNSDNEVSETEPDPAVGSDPNSEPDGDPKDAGSLDKEGVSGQFAEITNVHVVQEVEYFDGRQGEGQVWLRLPDCIYEDRADSDRIIIDNGYERLTLYKSQQAGQFSDSHREVQPVGEYWLLEQIESFRGRKEDDHFVMTKIEDESTADRIVYNIEATGSISARGKLWMDAAGMLPSRIEVRWTGDPNSQEMKAVRMTFDYGPIPDKAFDLRIPDGYTELPRKEAGTFTGHVTDLDGNAIAGAEVHVKSWSLPPSKKQLDDITDTDGFFSIKMLPNREGLLWPVVIWATLPDEPDFMAWTMLQSELKKGQHELGGEILGDPGNIRVKGTEGGTSSTGFCVGASDVVLVMAPAGKIAGRVTDSAGNSIANATIQVEFDLAGRFGNVAYPSLYFWQTSTSADADGYYIVGFLPPLWDKCRYRLSFGAEGFVSQKESVTTQGPLDEMIVDFQLHRAGVTVRGVLRDNYGKALGEREIYAMVEGKTYRDCRTKTKADGSFELSGCPVDERLQMRAELSHNHMPPHEKDKYDNYVFYPDAIVDVGYVEGKSEYDIEMVAVLPEITIDVEVVDLTGHPLEHFPVEVRAAGGGISSQWQSQRNLTLRTDLQGYCRFEGVPDIEGLLLVFSGGSGTWGDLGLDEEEKKFIEQVKRQHRVYKWTEVPIEVVPGEKEYSVRAVMLTKEQYEHGVQER